MTARVTLTRPAEGHTPNVGRKQIGKTPIRPTRPVYGTTLSCSCGWRPGKISNSAPTAGGRSSASGLYLRHVARSATAVRLGVDRAICNAVTLVADHRGSIQHNQYVLGIAAAEALIEAGLAEFTRYEETPNPYGDTPNRIWVLRLTEAGTGLAAQLDQEDAA